VCREVKEESNIDVDINTVVYVASQPWPFGFLSFIYFFWFLCFSNSKNFHDFFSTLFSGQIMIGCFARATSTQIQLNKEHVELEVYSFSNLQFLLNKTRVHNFDVCLLFRMFNGLVLMNYEKLWKNLQQQVILLNQRD
jgi:hypothetical protein